MVWYQWSFYTCHSGKPIKFFHNTQNNSFPYKIFGFCWWRCRRDLSEHQLFFLSDPHIFLWRSTSPPIHVILVRMSSCISLYLGTDVGSDPAWTIRVPFRDIVHERPSSSWRTMHSSESASLEWLLILFSAPWRAPTEAEVTSEESRVKRWNERESSADIVWSFRPYCDKSPPLDFRVMWIHCFPFFAKATLHCVVWQSLD